MVQLIDSEWNIYTSVNKTIIGSNNGLSPVHHFMNQCCIIQWELISLKFEHTALHLKKMSLKLSSAKWRPFGLGFNVLRLKLWSEELRSLINIYPRLALGWGLLSQFPPFRYFLIFLALSEHTLAIEYHVYIWQVSPQLSCGGTCQIYTWFKESKRYFCQIENFACGEINERSFSNPHPWCRNGSRMSPWWTPRCLHGYVMTCWWHRWSRYLLDRQADSRFVPSQWETALLCNDIFHWLGASLESTLQTWDVSRDTGTNNCNSQWQTRNMLHCC